MPGNGLAHKLFLFAVVLVAAAGLLGIAYYATTLRFDEPFEPPPREPRLFQLMMCESGDSCASVLDCADSRSPCIQRQVSLNMQHCLEHSAKERCDNLQRRLPQVTLVSDNYNLVDTPMAAPGYSVQLLPSDLRQSWDLELLPDGSLLVTQKSGAIVHLTSDGRQATLATLSVIDELETGLMGLAIDPEFAGNGHIYVMLGYRYGDGPGARLFALAKDNHPIATRVVHRISRFTLQEGALVDEQVILDDIPGSLMHAGGRLEFGPDGKLYATTGDAGIAQPSQVISFLGGKILRLNKDGSVPADNPFPGSYVYSMGHRNPQGVAWNKQSGEMYSADHGDVRIDEVNRIVPGGNYGWGAFRCDRRSSWLQRPGRALAPLVCLDYWNLSPSGMVFVSDKDSPWFGSLFVASLRGKHLHRYVFDGLDVVVDEVFYVSDGWDFTLPPTTYHLSRRIRDVEYHDGSLYVLGDNYGLVRLRPQVEP